MSGTHAQCPSRPGRIERSGLRERSVNARTLRVATVCGESFPCQARGLVARSE